MKELVPKGIPKGKQVVQEGINIGKMIEVQKSAFSRHRNVRCESDWKRMQAEKGNIQWNVEMGLSTVEDHVEALKYLWEWSKAKGIEIDRCLHISNMLNGLPLDVRSKVPKGTSFVLEDPDDWIRIAQAAPIAAFFGDHHIGSPNSVYNTANAVRAGASTVGALSQFTWTYPYCNDDVSHMVEIVKALGILASKRRDGVIHESSIGDGMSGQLIDHVSEIGYMRLEQYIVEELCGADYCAGLGYLMSDIPSKLATWLALHDTLKANIKTDHNVVSFMQGNTLEPMEDISTNYALTVAEFVPFAILERRYKTGCAYMADPAAECIRVPTLDEIIEVFSVCAVALRKALEYETTNMLNDSYINELRSVLVSKAKQFFENTIKGLSEMGVDIKDPLQLFIAVRRLGVARFEGMFHPGERDSNRPRGIVPFVPTDLIKRSMKEKDKVVKEILAKQLGDVLRDKKIVVGSTDTHEYGLFVVGATLKDLGAKVVDGGTDLTAEEFLDLAFKEGTPNIAISTHNGQCLDYGKLLISLSKQRNQQVKVFMGGRLNAILEGATEPVDVSDQLAELGIVPCKEVGDFVKVFPE